MVFLHPVTNKGLEDDPNNALSPSAFFVPLKQAYQFERSLLLQLNGLSEWHFVLLKWSLSLRLNGTLCAVALEENSHSGAQLLARNLGSGIGFVEFWEGSGVAFTDPAVTVDSRAKSLSLCVFFFFYLSVPGSLSWKKPSPGSAECFLTASRRPPCQCGRARPRHRSLLTGARAPLLICSVMVRQISWRVSLLLKKFYMCTEDTFPTPSGFSRWILFWELNS